MNSVCAQGLCLGIGGQPKRICDCSLTQGLVGKQGGGGAGSRESVQSCCT